METPKDKILRIIERLGMSGVKAAEIMKIADNTFRKNKMESVPSHNFTTKNYTDLIDFLIDEIKFLITYKESPLSDADAYRNVMDKIINIFYNYPKNSNEENWNLFDELKQVVDFMENPAVFNDIKVYSKTIDYIVFSSMLIENEPNTFTSDKYSNYVHSDKIGNHVRWNNYIIHKRTERINEILND